MSIDNYLLDEYRLKRGKDADALYKLVDSIKYIIDDVHKSTKCEKNYFAWHRRKAMQSYIPPDDLWFGNTCRAYVIAHRELLIYRERNLWNRYKLYKSMKVYKAKRIDQLV